MFKLFKGSAEENSSSVKPRVEMSMSTSRPTWRVSVPCADSSITELDIAYQKALYLYRKCEKALSCE